MQNNNALRNRALQILRAEFEDRSMQWLLGLDRCDVDWRGMQLLIVRRHNHTWWSLISLRRECREVIAAYLEQVTEGPLFQSRKGRRLSARQANKVTAHDPGQ